MQEMIFFHHITFRMQDYYKPNLIRTNWNGPMSNHTNTERLVQESEYAEWNMKNKMYAHKLIGGQTYELETSFSIWQSAIRLG